MMTTGTKMTEKILLTQGQFAIIDKEDFEYLNQFKWCAHFERRSYYAVRSSKRDPITHKQKFIMMHRVIMDLKHGDGRQVDHINQNTLDNRRSNLEIATHRSNGGNRHDQSEYGPGVWLNPKTNRFQVSVKINHRKIHVGVFDTAEEAQLAREQHLRENV